MCSKFVRDIVLDFISTELSGETVIDLTAEFEELDDMLEYHGVASGSDWVGIQFVGSEETPVDIRATDSKGTYRETGIFSLHIVAIAKIGSHNGIMTRVEAIRDKFRGRRIDTIIVESVSPPNFGAGTTLSFTGGYTAATFNIGFNRQFSL
jgi:predicted GNAT family acetyltransferase